MLTRFQQRALELTDEETLVDPDFDQVEHVDLTRYEQYARLVSLAHDAHVECLLERDRGYRDPLFRAESY